MNDIGEVGTRQGAPQLCFISDPRDPEIGHKFISPPCSARPAFGYTFVTELTPVGNSTFTELPKLFNI